MPPTTKKSNIPLKRSRSGTSRAHQHQQRQRQQQPLASADSNNHRNGFATRPISTGRKVSLDSKYDPLLTDHLKHLGWQNLCEIPPKVYPQLVRMFYCNLREELGAKYKVVSYVKGVGIERVGIELDVGDIARILGLPVGGSQVYFVNQQELSQLVANEEEFYRAITTNRVFGGGVKSRDLHPRLLLLNRFLMDNVIPRKGHYDDVLPFQCYLLYNIVADNALCLPYIMMKEMIKATESGRALPFGGLLTKVFKDYEVNLDGEQVMKLKEDIGSKTIKKMHIDASSEKEQGEGQNRVEVEHNVVKEEEPMAEGEHSLGNVEGFAQNQPRASRSLDEVYVQQQQIITQQQQLFTQQQLLFTQQQLLFGRQEDLGRRFDQFSLNAAEQFTNLNTKMDSFLQFLDSPPTP